MSSIARKSAGPGCVPPRQHNLDDAEASAWEAMGAQADEQLAWLGAVRAESAWRLAVLNDFFDFELEVDPAAGHVRTSGGRDVKAKWRILVLHYLAVRSRPPTQPPGVTFADLSAARAYAGVYQGRVIARLCATAGRDLDSLNSAAASAGGRKTDGGDAAFDFDIFPRIAARLIWHAADEEFPPSATLLMPGNIEAFFSIEDIVIISELLVSRLSGQDF